jgi:hypothetical protein
MLLRFTCVLSCLATLTLTCLAQDWQPVTEELLKSEKTGFGGLCGIAVHPPTGDLYVNLSDRGFFRSKDQGATWQRLGTAELKGRTETPLCLMIDPIEHKRFVTAFVYGSPIMISNDLESPGKAVSEKSGHVDWCAVNWKDPGEGLILTLKHEAADLLLVSRDGGNWQGVRSRVGLRQPDGGRCRSQIENQHSTRTVADHRCWQDIPALRRRRLRSCFAKVQIRNFVLADDHQPDQHDRSGTNVEETV